MRIVKGRKRRQQATEVVKIQASLKRRKIVIIEAGVHDVFRLRSDQQLCDKRSFVVSVVYVTFTSPLRAQSMS